MLRRINLPNQIYFITSKTFRNQRIFAEDWACGLSVEVLKYCKEKYRFKLYGYVVLPDHIHLLIQPTSRDTVSDVMRHIKGRFARLYIQAAADEVRGYAEQGIKLNITSRGRGLYPRHKDQPDNQGYSADHPKTSLTVTANKVRGYAEENISSRRRGLYPRHQNKFTNSKIWQKSFYDHAVRPDTDKDFLEKLNYIHNNPLKHRLTENLENYSWSSFQNYYLNNHTLIAIDEIIP